MEIRLLESTGMQPPRPCLEGRPLNFKIDFQIVDESIGVNATTFLAFDFALVFNYYWRDNLSCNFINKRWKYKMATCLIKQGLLSNGQIACRLLLHFFPTCSFICG